MRSGCAQVKHEWLAATEQRLYALEIDMSCRAARICVETPIPAELMDRFALSRPGWSTPLP